ncbi:hypothetical protein M2451_001843 [Dysgonomonas sp. PFB1-18]|uniref:hypothetical protein n=1 Tax=unclassified Dysgonomonas TaxID=2630389 RepID=UPI00247640FE|nr:MULTISPECIES: hypothetical protein [unclassified Dysgonomonas]MDH6309272.1 hypothetical protein [Dysgonomonas sp. PF1-14]MDH6338848.1 hypothetical protein [Dysgonomonas sp. PF1-16]MDH6380521.1 hypothetical protein [Dysgonomonas sp. PFB1-18]MDH6397676.1 hypothetical protein [Dysgonomonas sp. PF1-23]
MKKILLSFIFIVLLVNRTFACGGGDDYYDGGYYNLFMQEIIDDPQYYPFLLTLAYAYYEPDAPGSISNENIEEWAKYWGTGYSETRYLVFNVSKEALDKIIAGRKTDDAKLAFLTPAFAKKHKAALEYLSYAKYLEPYMSIKSSGSSWYYYPENTNSADMLNYNEVTLYLQKKWKSLPDKELKLRYGYQLVRFAHYSGRYEDAVNFFNTYVEPLNHKPAMYYHALSQKAGAERGLGNIMDANYNFFRVFSNSKNLKQMAVTSLKFTEGLSVKEFLDQAKTENEKNDAYLLLGYFAFSNPLNEIEKIVKTSPDAIQAKVLMARAVNLIEREMIPSYYYRVDHSNMQDKRYPLPSDNKMITFLRNTMALSNKMVASESVKDKNFWYLTTAYLHFLNKDFTSAKNYLDKVKTVDDKYKVQTRNLNMYIDICERPAIGMEDEIYIYSRYKDVLNPSAQETLGENERYINYSTYNFVTDILANRYYLQGDYAKSFLLHHNIKEMEENPDLGLLDAIESFYRKSGKNDLEKLIIENITPPDDKNLNIISYINHVRGIAYLANAYLEKALDAFNKTTLADNRTISSNIFGYNKIECFECEEDEVMVSDYLKDFPYINDMMSIKEITETLIKLRNAGQQSGELAAKANYLLGNFYYNTTRTGYFRHVLRFDRNNSNCWKYNLQEKEDIYGTQNIYFKSYRTYYNNNVGESSGYLQKAYEQAQNRELKARIAFALSKCEQEEYYDRNDVGYYYKYNNNKGDDGILITKRQYFKELAKYKNTKFYDQTVTWCKYFDYYVTNCM